MKQQNQSTNSNIVSINQKRKQKTSSPVWKSHSLVTKLIVIALIAISGVMIVGIGNQLQQANQLDQKIEKAKAEKEFAEKQKESLTQQVELLQSDEYIAKFARSEYYLSKNGEIILKRNKSKKKWNKGKLLLK